MANNWDLTIVAVGIWEHANSTRKVCCAIQVRCRLEETESKKFFKVEKLCHFDGHSIWWIKIPALISVYFLQPCGFHIFEWTWQVTCSDTAYQARNSQTVMNCVFLWYSNDMRLGDTKFLNVCWNVLFSDSENNVVIHTVAAHCQLRIFLFLILVVRYQLCIKTTEFCWLMNLNRLLPSGASVCRFHNSRLAFFWRWKALEKKPYFSLWPNGHRSFWMYLSKLMCHLKQHWWFHFQVLVLMNGMHPWRQSERRVFHYQEKINTTDNRGIQWG